MANDIFKSPCNTIKLLLRTGAIPYLVLDYSRKSIQVLMNRVGFYIMCEAEFIDFQVALKVMPVLTEDVDVAIMQSTKITIDGSVITDEMFNDLLEAISHAGEIIRSRMIQIDNKKGTGFTESDFITLTRLATKAKLDEDFWSMD